MYDYVFELGVNLFQSFMFIGFFYLFFEPKYEKVRNIATEAKQKLSLIRPLTIGQASRISGVNPADISMLLIYLKKEYPNE